MTTIRRRSGRAAAWSLLAMAMLLALGACAGDPCAGQGTDSGRFHCDRSA